jgi:dTDP-glucose 4,6-dehydratase/UDP-glucuronate decarboxylase
MSLILVTGGAGLIGSALCKSLLRDGHNVLAIDSLITSNGENLKQFKNNPNFKFVKQDISKNFNIKSSNIKTVYHLACPTGVPNLTKLSEEMLLACSAGTLNVIKTAFKNNAKLIFTSSPEVYGDPKVFPQKETYNGNVDPTGIRGPYEEGKRFSEALILAYFRKHNLDSRIVRVFNTYGPGSSENETRVVSKFLRAAINGEPLTVEGNGEQTRTFCYVDDLVDALIKIAEQGKTGEIYNAGSDKEISILKLAKLILKITGSKSNIEFIKRPTHDHSRRLPYLKKIRQLGWEQTIDIKRGINLIIRNAYIKYQSVIPSHKTLNEWPINKF